MYIDCIVARPSKIYTTMSVKKQVFRPFGPRIKSERQRLAMSLAKFAAIGSVSKTTQLAYESGTHVPTLSYLVDVAELGVDATYILSGKHGHSYGGDVLNWELMEQLIKVLEDCESERARPLSVSVKVNALRLLYSQFSSSGVIDYKLVKAALAMAA